MHISMIPVVRMTIAVLLCLAMYIEMAIAAEGDLDPTFGTHGIVTEIGSGYDTANDVAVQADGKIVLVGFANGIAGASSSIAVTRYNTTGELDSSFGGGDGIAITSIPVGSENSTQAKSLAIQDDGKIVVVGNVTGEWGNPDFVVLRYNEDGTLDSTFGEGDGIVITEVAASSNPNDMANSVAIQSDGKIVVAGYSYNGSNDDFAITRYNSNGTLDTSFGDGDGIVTTPVGSSVDRIECITIQDDGKIVVAGRTYSGSNKFAVARYTNTGTLDTTFGGGDGIAVITVGYNDAANGVALQSDGKIVVAGYTSDAQWSPDFALVRLTINGELDTSFGGGDGIVVTAVGSSDSLIQDVAVLDDGKIIAAGTMLTPSDYNFALTQYDNSGNLDSSFGNDGIITTEIGVYHDELQGVAIQSDGKIVAAGYSATRDDGVNNFAAIRYNSDGTIDTSFGEASGIQTTAIGSSSSYARSVTIQDDDKILVVGDTESTIAMVRYDLYGNPDRTFGNGDGIVTTPSGIDAYSVALQDDGKIVVGGESSYNFAVLRFDASGTLDPTFGGGDGLTVTDIGGVDQLRSVAIQNDGKIILAGASDNNIILARYDSSGNLDTAFGGGDGIAVSDFESSIDAAYDVAILDDGRIIVAGVVNDDFALLRYDSNGILDNTFGGGDGLVTTPIGSFSDTATNIIVQEDGKIVLGGHSQNMDINWDFAIVRYNSDGTLDTGFGSGSGVVTTPIGTSDDYLENLLIDHAGRLIAIGRIDLGDDDWDFAVVRYTSDGLIDTTFDDDDGIVITPIGSTYDHAFGSALQRDGKIVVAGYSYNIREVFKFAVVRYLGSLPPSVAGDISGDGTIDLSDAILGLQVLTGQNPVLSPLAVQAADVDGDNSVGASEVIYILKELP